MTNDKDFGGGWFLFLQNCSLSASARTIFSIAAADEDYFAKTSFPDEKHALFAAGLREPLLGMPSLSE